MTLRGVLQGSVWCGSAGNGEGKTIPDMRDELLSVCCSGVCLDRYDVPFDV